MADGQVPLPFPGSAGAASALPFLKWAGGKGALLDAFEPLYPRTIAAYHEPFLGAAAVFFRLTGTGRIDRAWLSDANRDLVLAFAVVRDRAPELAAALEGLARGHDQAAYYRERERFNRDSLDDVERAARVIYLNRTGYNGLYRVNSRGEFNVPAGRYPRPRIVDRPGLALAARALARATVEVRDFATVLDRAQPGDFVYLDPPYDPLSRTSSFTGYASGGFPSAEQERLAQVFADLDRKAVRLMLSNHDTPLVRELYRGYDLTVLAARRAINSKPSRRATPVAELVVRNYR